MVAAVAPMVVLLALPTAVPAATTCDLGGGLLEVQMPATGDRAYLLVSGIGEIEVRNGEAQVTCTGGPPSVSNVNVISIFNAPNGAGNHVYIVAPDRFAPGASTVGENGGTPEIEISVNLNDRPDSELLVGGVNTGAPIRFGTSGINPNATAGEVQPDADILYANVPELIGAAGAVTGSTLSAQGGAGSGGALTVPITFYGGEHADVLIGGEGNDEFDGYRGSDTILGMGGDDEVDVFPTSGENPSIDGGAGADYVRFDGPSGVTVDLAIAGPQSPGSGGTVSLAGIENVIGTELNDVLRGDAGSNSLAGSLGDDVLEGRGGVDALDGSAGADSLFARDGEGDSALCGPEVDTVTADAAGIDALTDCENVLFPPPPGSDPPGGGPDVPGATTGRCGRKKATITGTKAGERITGTRRRDVIDAGSGDDKVRGLGGNDIVCGGRGKDRLDGGKGTDVLSGDTGNDKLSGGPGRDRLSGGGGNDNLAGGGGNDRLLGGAGRDVLLGGTSRDTCLGEIGRRRLGCERSRSANR